MKLTVPGRCMPLTGGVGYATDATVTFQWIVADPFAIMITAVLPDLVVEFFTDVQMLAYIIDRKHNTLLMVAPGQPVQLRYAHGLFGAKVELEDRTVFLTVVGANAQAIETYIGQVGVALEAEKAAIEANVDRELAALFHPGEES